MTVSETFVRKLEKVGIKYIFGVPGDIENEFFIDLKDSNIEFVNVMHEQAGAFAADVYSRVTGEVGVCFSTLGPGGLNMSTGVANAFQDRSSIIAITGQLPDEKQFIGSHQYVNFHELYDQFCKDTVEIQSGSDVKALIDYAVKLSLTNPKGPVHISIPVNVLVDPVGDDISEIKGIKDDNDNNSDLLQRIEDLGQRLSDSQRTVAIIGEKNMFHSDLLSDFITETNIPFYSTFHGKGTVSENNELFCGVLSRHSTDAKTVINNSDLLLNIGFDVIEGIDQTFWSDVDYTVHIGEYSDVIIEDYYEPDLIISGELSYVIRQILENCSYKKQDVHDISRLKIRNQFRVGHHTTSESLDTRYVVSNISEKVDSEALVISDVGAHKQDIGFYLSSADLINPIFTNGLSSMGFAVPSAIGAHFADQDKVIIVISGDGGFMMNVQELSVIAELDIPVKIFVINNGGYGLVYDAQIDHGHNSYASKFMQPRNVQKLCDGFGVKTMKFNSASDFAAKIDEILIYDGPVVCDIRVGEK
jgi:acetolactate synthase-1/2/3 large subunit